MNPHPDLADAYAHLRPGNSARERLARVESLAAKSPGNVEAALAVARAALDAQRVRRRARGARAAIAGADPAGGGADGRARAEPSTATRAAPANG